MQCEVLALAVLYKNVYAFMLWNYNSYCWNLTVKTARI